MTNNRLSNRRSLRIRRKTKQVLTRPQRLALAPREPRGIVLQYIKETRSIISDVQDLISEELLGQRNDSSAIIVPIPVLSCGPKPHWYGVSNSIRLDALDNRYRRLFANLELAISRRVDPKKIRRIITDIFDRTSEHNREEVTRILKINLRQTDEGMSEIIDQFIEDNVRLIQSVAFDQLSQIEQIVDQGVTSGVRVEDLSQQIHHSFGVNRSRATLIARDQVLKANASITEERQTRVGIEEYIWTTSNDERVRGRPGGKWANNRSNHWDLEGTKQLWSKPPVTNPVTGDRNHPGRDYMCRCIPVPVVDSLLYRAS